MTYENHQPGNTVEGAAQEQGEVKCGGEDGKASNGGPHKEKKGGDKADVYSVRRGRGTVHCFCVPHSPDCRKLLVSEKHLSTLSIAM